MSKSISATYPTKKRSVWSIIHLTFSSIQVDVYYFVYIDVSLANRLCLTCINNNEIVYFDHFGYRCLLHRRRRGKVTWTLTASGGRTAQVAFHDISSVGAKTKRGSPGSSVESWTTLGQIANYAAEYACQDSGAYALSSAIGASAKGACKELVGMIPGAPIANKAWNVWQGAKAAANGEGEQVQTIFRFFYLSTSAPKLDEAMCNRAISILTEGGKSGLETMMIISKLDSIQTKSRWEELEMEFDCVR